MTQFRDVPPAALSRYALLIAGLLPAIVAVFLGAPGRLFLAVPASVGLNLLFRAERYAEEERTRARLRIIIPVLLAAATFFIVISILIIPFSVYLAWFRMVDLGSPRGAVSHVFVSVTAFFSGVISGQMYRKGVSGPTALIATFLLVIVTMVSQSVVPVLIAVPVVIAAIVLQAERDPRRRARRPIIASAMGIVVLATLAALPLVARDATRGNRYIDNRLSPALRRTVLRLLPNYPLLYGGDGYGYSFDEHGLGGTPLLSSVPIFEVRALPGERIYLRTDVFDHYSGTSWMRSSTLIERLQDINADLSTPFNGAATTADLPVTILTEFFEKVPHTLNTRAVMPMEEAPTRRIRGTHDVGFLFDLPLGRDDTIVLQRVLDDRPIYDRNLRRNLQLPEEIPSEVRRIAQDLGRGKSDPRDVLAAITSYLADGFNYSLEINPTLDQVDFVEDFLLGTRTGYCVHFATSFVVLARMNNIPARYVTGFLVSVPDVADFYDDLFAVDFMPDEDGFVRHRVTGYSAHAWPEVWLPDSGWVVWEATPAMRLGEFDDLAFLLASMDPDSMTSRQLREILGHVEERSSGVEATAGETGAHWYSLLMIPGATLAGAVLVGFRRRYVPIVDTRRALHSLAMRLSRMSARRSILEPRSTGWRDWTKTMGNLLPEQKATVVAAGDLIQRTYFGDYRPQRRELALLRDVERAMMERVPVGIKEILFRR